MRYFNKMFILILCLTFLNWWGNVNADEKKWKKVIFFKRQDIKMRLIKYDPPIVLEWGKLTNGEKMPSKLQPLAVQGYFVFMDIDYAEWKSNFTLEYLKFARVSKDKFENFIRMKKSSFRADFPSKRFLNILYEIDYMIDGREYSIIVKSTEGTEKIITWPKDKTSGVATVMRKLNDKWVIDNLNTKNLPYEGLLDFTNYNLLEKIIKTGFVYQSRKHGRVWPFEPSEILKTDSALSK